MSDSIRNPKSAIRNREVSRRVFLAGIPYLALSASAASGADLLQVLKPNDFERLKLDFNSNRAKVRLFFVLSPT